MNKVVHSSKKDDWGTPWAFFDRLDAEFDFEFDAAASPNNAKCDAFCCSGSLGMAWAGMGRTWCNPPYGRQIGDWIDKAIAEGMRTVVVMLVPARTDTKWWARAVKSCQEVRFVKGRIKFEGAESGAPFPSAVLVWSPRTKATDGSTEYQYSRLTKYSYIDAKERDIRAASVAIP